MKIYAKENTNFCKAIDSGELNDFGYLLMSSYAPDLEHIAVLDEETGRGVWVVPKKSLDQLYTEKFAELNMYCDAILDSVASQYPRNEVLTWTEQSKEAHLYIESEDKEESLASMIYIPMIAQQRGLSLDEMVQRVLTNDVNWRWFSAFIVAQRLKMEDDLTNFYDNEDYENVRDFKISYQF